METKTLSALIVDDEPAARLALTRRLQVATTAIEICGEAANGKEALDLIEMLSPDIVFLDIAMPGRSGLEIARHITGEGAPMIVFLTAFGDRALEAFETDAIDYLMKPVAAARLEQCVKRILTEADKRRQLSLSRQLLSVVEKYGAVSEDQVKPTVLALNVGDGVMHVNEEEVLQIEAAGEYACVHTQSETFVVRESLKCFETDLLSRRFFRIHRRTIVNLDYVEQVHTHKGAEYFAQLRNGQKLAVSRRRYAGLKAVLEARAS